MKAIRSALLVGVCLAAGSITLPAPVSAGVVVDVDVAPPPVRVEEVPGPRPGYVWAPGYWEWRGHEHVWVGGRWIGERRGYHWAPDHWVQYGPHWRHERGHWER